MEIVKTPSNQAPPYDPQSNYTISWDIDPAVYDFSTGYILLPMALTESYTTINGGGSFAGAVANVSLSSSSGQVNLATMNVRSVRLTVDGQDIYYCPRVNQLIASLGTFAYNLPQERLEEYFAGVVQTYPAGLEAGTAVSYSVFRELLNDGAVPSSKFNASLRIPVSRLLDGFTDQIRDLKKYSGITLTIELDDITPFANAIEPNPDYGSTVRLTGAVNTLGYGTAYPGVTSGGNTWTSTAVITVEDFPFTVGDTLTFTTGPTGVITAIANNGGGLIVATIGAGGLTDANPNPITVASVGSRKLYLLAAATTINGVAVPITTVAQAEAIIPKNTQVTVYNNTNSFTMYDTFVYDYVVAEGGGRVLAQFNIPSPAGAGGVPIRIAGIYMATGGLFLSTALTPGNGIAVPGLQPTVDNFSALDFPLWVGQAVLVTSPTATIVTKSTVISEISYDAAAGFASLSFSPPLLGLDGNAIAADTLVVVPQKADSIAISYPEVLQHVQYRLNAMTSMGLETSPMYRRWVYDADTLPTLPASGTYEKTFILEPGCDFVVIALCPQGTLTSNVDGLLSYRLRLDGIDTTSRDILLSGDQSYRFERLLNGYTYLSDDLDAISTNQAINPMVLDAGTYVILQDLIVDGKQHQLTVSLRNGSGGTYSQRNVGCYKRIISQMM